MDHSFALEPLLQLRREVELSKAQRVAEAQRSLAQEQAALEAVDSTLGTNAGAKNPDVARLAELERAKIALENRLHLAQSALQQAEMELRSAFRDREIIESLKKRHVAEHAAAASRKEEAELDEANSA